MLVAPCLPAGLLKVRAQIHLMCLSGGAAAGESGHSPDRRGKGTAPAAHRGRSRLLAKEDVGGIRQVLQQLERARDALSAYLDGRLL